MDAQNLAVLLLGDDLDEAFLLADGHRFSQRAEVELANGDLEAFRFRFALRQSDACHFGNRINAIRHRSIVESTRAALNDVGDDVDAGW